MKKLIIAIMIIIIPTVTMAEEEKEDICKRMADFGKTVMMLRQKEFPLDKVMGTFADQPVKAQKLMKHIVIRAYKVPYYTTDSYKKKAVKKFYNKLYLECLQAKGE